MIFVKHFKFFFHFNSPFERNETENNEIYEILLTLDEFKELFPAHILENELLMKRLFAYAVLETVSYADTPGLLLINIMLKKNILLRIF